MVVEKDVIVKVRSKMILNNLVVYIVPILRPTNDFFAYMEDVEGGYTPFII